MLKSGKRFQDVDDRTEELQDAAEAHPDLWREFLSRYELSWIYHENALEGIVLTHAELTSALKGRPIAPDTYHAIRNLKMAISRVRKAATEEDRRISLDMVQELHTCLGAGEKDFVSGDYRKIIPLHRTYFHDIAQPQAIGPRMLKLMDWARDNDPGDEEAVQFVTQFHHEFMSIFPYPEHTGKVGRLLVNFILVRHGYMPVIFHGSERQRYYECLRHNPKEMEGFLTEMMNNCIENGLKFIHKELEERAKAEGRGLFAVS